MEKNTIQPSSSRRKIRYASNVFVLPPGEGKNKAPEKTITEMEKFLIKAGYERNKDIMNTHHAKDDTWTIKGVYGKRGKGKPNKEESSFRTMLKL